MLAAAATRVVALGWRSIRRLRPGGRPTVIVDGDRWLRHIMASAAAVVRPADPRARRAVASLTGPGRVAPGGQRTVPAFSYRSSGGVELDDAPFVAVDAVFRRRHLRGAPADLIARALDASRAAPAPPSDDSDRGAVEYLARARDVHLRYRAASRRTSLDVVEEMTGATVGAVTVLCVTNRPHLVPNVLESVERQEGCDLDLLVVTHGEHCSDEASDVLRGVVGARQISVPGHLSLGACLNAGLAECRRRYVAKFDDDDYYGERYLADSLIAVRASGAAVVGKHSYFVHLVGTDRTLLRFPGRECRPTTYLAGGTLLLDLHRLRRVRFPDLTVGEDQGLLRRCILRGRGVFAGDMFNYVQHRGTHNTWSVDDEYLSRGALDVGPGDPAAIASV